jgi:4-amino-4-deoxy-L-arabinose transferase-like glycosyltransferase
MTSPEEETISKEIQSQTEIPPVVKKIWLIISEFKFILLIAFLAFFVKVAYSSSIDMWDEGWFAAIFSRMADGLSDPFLPLYWPAEGMNVKFFDKPPAAFWGGAILMNIFGRTTFAAKGIIVLGGAGLAVIIYLLFSHQAENKSGAVIAGLLVALVSFLTFYSRTAYIDPFVIFMSALVMLLSVRMVDAVFVENNMRKGYILLIIMAIVNVFNILTKAWQGILTFPAIAIYLLFRYLERHIRKDDFKFVWDEIRSNFTLSPKKMSSNLIITLDSADVKVPFPFLVMLVAFICSFMGSYIITNLIASSLVLAIVSGIGCYIVFLRKSIIQDKILYIPGLISGSIAGFIGGILGGFIVKVFYGRLASSFIDIAQAFGEEDVFSGGIFSEFFFLSSEEFLSNSNLALLILDLLASLFGSILTFVVILFLVGIMLDVFTRCEKFFKIIYETLVLIPLVILGLWFVFWFAGILLLGLFFERKAWDILVFGFFISFIITPIVIFIPRIKSSISIFLKLNFDLKSREELKVLESHLLFACIAITLLILSFIPFTAWVQYLDTNIANGTFPWVIRVPGELSGDPNRPDPVTYTFLFFEYYISWRYTHGTKYSLPDSVGSALNDYVLVVMLPFFIVGLFAFFLSEKRNPALGSLFITWLVTVPFIFFPAQFQLNYYYIPLAIPYLAIAAKGIEYIYSNERWRITVTDNIERLLAGGYFYLDIGLKFVFFPILTFIGPVINFLTGAININLFVGEIDSLVKFLFIACLYLIPFTFIAFRVLKTFPGIITAGFAYKYFMDSWKQY